MTAQQYVHDHRLYLINFVKYIGPWVVAIFAALGWLVGSGYLDVPARSSIVERIIVDVGKNKMSIDSLQNVTRGIFVNNAVTTEKLKSIDGRLIASDARLKSIDGKLDRIIDQMIQRSRAE